MKDIWLIAIFGIGAFCLGLNCGMNVAEKQITEYENTKYEQAVRNYESALKALEMERQRAEQSATKRLSDIDALNARVDALRVQLSEANSRSENNSDKTANRSCSTVKLQREWDRKMGEVLKRATDLIEERDRIAIDYNTLMEGCRLGNHD